MTVAMLLPDQTYKEQECEEVVLQACDQLLARYRIRPEFFCRFRENVAALQRRHHPQRQARSSTHGSHNSHPSSHTNANK
ncbi:unnamed protein product [Bemisia tabaci]|uniref:Uncharacterized protein n=1 Tax=Bemisia tabaci TaxID=7038 RepID=A0A9P0G2F0_BEMTA|nr:unnamed protein product [Bemisia tabaci]